MSLHKSSGFVGRVAFEDAGAVVRRVAKHKTFAESNFYFSLALHFPFYSLMRHLSHRRFSWDRNFTCVSPASIFFFCVRCATYRQSTPWWLAISATLCFLECLWLPGGFCFRLISVQHERPLHTCKAWEKEAKTHLSEAENIWLPFKEQIWLKIYCFLLLAQAAALF